MPTPRRARHDEHYAIHYHYTTCSHHCAYDRALKRRSTSIQAPVATHLSDSRAWTVGVEASGVQPGRHSCYRYKHLVHRVGMARHGGHRSMHAHTTTTTNYSARDGEPLHHCTTPYPVPTSDKAITLYHVHMYLVRPLVSYKWRRQGPIREEKQQATHTHRHSRESKSTLPPVFTFHSWSPFPSLS